MHRDIFTFTALVIVVLVSTACGSTQQNTPVEEAHSQTEQDQTEQTQTEQTQESQTADSQGETAQGSWQLTVQRSNPSIMDPSGGPMTSTPCIYSPQGSIIVGQCGESTRQITDAAEVALIQRIVAEFDWEGFVQSPAEPGPAGGYVTSITFERDGESHETTRSMHSADPDLMRLLSTLSE